MASTYTSELRIEKIATGEQSGTWGTTTNTQYDLWEAAISGTTTVAFASDGNDTLSTASGSDDEARHMFINLSGGSTLTATREMVCPTSSKLYIVDNNTTGGQDVTFKTTAGTGITIPNGARMAVYCDGTNVVDAFTHINTATFVTALAVASGGTGAATLTDGGVLLGSGTGAITAMSVLTDGQMIVGDGTTDPVAESGATLRTSIGVGTGDSPQFTGIELGHATDSTITRVSAGLLAIEGDNIATMAADQTFTGDQTFGPITETQTVKAVSFTPSLTAEGTVYNCNAAITITMPAAEAGKGFTIIHDDGTEITWAGTILWAGGAAPTAAAAVEIYVFLSDGTNWYGNLAGTGFA
jgi:hypothetical protein